MFDIKKYMGRIDELGVSKDAKKIMREEIFIDLQCMNRLCESGYIDGEVKKLFEVMIENMFVTLEGKNINKNLH